MAPNIVSSLEKLTIEENRAALSRRVGWTGPIHESRRHWRSRVVHAVDPDAGAILIEGASRATRAIGAGGAIRGYSLNLDQIDIMGASLAGFEVVCEDADPETLVDGLIGLDFLRTRVLTIDGVNGQITLGP